MWLIQDVFTKNVKNIQFTERKVKRRYFVTNITSCWALDKTGICKVKKSKEKEWSERLLVLEQTIQCWIDSPTSKMIEVIQLFYDCE